MDKSYILKFDKTKGDYVIVEEGGAQTPQSRRKNFFQAFGSGIFKKREQEMLKTGLNNYDKMQLNSSLAEEGAQNPTDLIPNAVAPNQNRPQDNQENQNQNLQENLTPLPNQNPNLSSPTQDGAIAVSDSLPLITSLYGKFRVLNMIYQNLRSINGNFAQIFNDYIIINTQLQGGLLNVFNQLSNTRAIQPVEQMPALPSEAQAILKIVSDQIQQMREINYQLLNLFEVPSIDRLFGLIETALSIQADKVFDLRL